MTNINQDDIKKTHKELLDDFRESEERLATDTEVRHMQGILGKDIFSDLIFAPVEDKEKPRPKMSKAIERYLIPFPKRTIRERDHDLENEWDKMISAQKRGDPYGFIQSVNYILDHHLGLLAIQDMFYIQASLIYHYIDLEEYDNAIYLLENLKSYEKRFNDIQKRDILYLLGITYFQKANQNQDIPSYTTSIAYFDKLFGPNLATDKYMEILSKKSYALFRIGRYDDCITATEELLKGSEDIDEAEMDTLPYKTAALKLQGFAYERKREYKKAIESLNEYLGYFPDDEKIRNRIKTLEGKMKGK